MFPSVVPKDVSSIKFASRLLEMFGTLNYESRPMFLIFACYKFFLMIWGLFGSFVICILKSHEHMEMFQAVSLFVAYIHITGKTTNALINGKKINKLLKRLETVRLERLQNKENEIFILRNDKYLINFMIVYNTLLFLYPITSASLNFINDYKEDFKNPHMILPIWIPWNINEFWKYLGASFFQILIIINSSVYYSSFTSLLFTSAFQISGFLKALQHHLETHGWNSKTVYQQHITIIQLIKEYNSIFSGQMYLEILVSPLQPCGFGYALIKALKENDPSAGSLILITLITSSASFILCYYGQEVSTQMENLHKSTYMNRWYEEKPKVRRDLLQMMVITNNPTVFNYRRWIHFDYVTFATVMQGVYSYLSMMAHFIDD